MRLATLPVHARLRCDRRLRDRPGLRASGGSRPLQDRAQVRLPCRHPEEQGLLPRLARTRRQGGRQT